ncbi:MAG: dihydroorotate dehydrogenase [Planctomycetales bacterium]|nr:dihydroorotate dehydrogenase [Planctomycetales bacterium]
MSLPPSNPAAPAPKFAEIDLRVSLGRLALRNPILTASGTFGYAREMEKLVDFSLLGGILPKTVTKAARIGNKPWRTVETSAGLLNSIGLDNDGIDAFIEHHLPYLATLPTAIIVSIAGANYDEFVEMAKQLDGLPGVAAIELNISCPNVAHGVDFGVDPATCAGLVAAVRSATTTPILAKLTPNVTRIADIAVAAAEAGADAISLINTVLGMAIDWKKRRPMLGNVVGGLSGPAIKPIALRCVHQAFQMLKSKGLSTPLIGIGGIATIDDVMEFIVAGASAVQIGTANYYDPTVTMKLVEAIPGAIQTLGAKSIGDVVGTLRS